MQWRTFLGYVMDADTLLVRHEAKRREDDEARKH